MTYLLLKYLHVLGGIIILGTGIGIAFFMLMAHRSGEPGFIARTANNVVLADYLFTATAVIAQPITGYLLMREMGIALSEKWIAASFVLYIAIGACWLPVVWLQRRMRDLAATASATGEPLPPDYHRLFRLWFILGFPGFGAVLAIIWLMISKPTW